MTVTRCLKKLDKPCALKAQAKIQQILKNMLMKSKVISQNYRSYEKKYWLRLGKRSRSGLAEIPKVGSSQIEMRIIYEKGNSRFCKESFRKYFSFYIRYFITIITNFIIIKFLIRFVNIPNNYVYQKYRWS